MATISVPVDVQVQHVAERLVHDFAGQVDDSVVRGLVADAF